MNTPFSSRNMKAIARNEISNTFTSCGLSVVKQIVAANIQQVNSTTHAISQIPAVGSTPLTITRQELIDAGISDPNGLYLVELQATFSAEAGNAGKIIDALFFGISVNDNARPDKDEGGNWDGLTTDHHVQSMQSQSDTGRYGNRARQYRSALITVDDTFEKVSLISLIVVDTGTTPTYTPTGTGTSTDNVANHNYFKMTKLQTSV